MKLKQIAISIENSPRRLYEVTSALGDAGINLRALTLVESGGGFGLLRLLVSDVATTRRILMQNHVPAQVNEVVAVEIEDRRGGSFLVASKGGAPKNPVWVYNLRADPNVEIRDETVVKKMQVREIIDVTERTCLWKIAVNAFPPYAEYQERTERTIPLFVAEPA